MKIAVVCCLHGDERYGLEVIKRLPSYISSFIGNKEALNLKKRCVDADMNRIFPGKQKGNYEERRANKLIKNLESFNYVIDLHSSSNNCPLFGIITKPTREKINMAKKMNLKKLVIMPESFASGKALIDFVKTGISLEIGPHERKENIEEVKEKILNLDFNASSCKDSEKESLLKNKIEIYRATKIIKKKVEGEILINNFENVEKGDLLVEGQERQFADFDFTPVLVNENAYEGVLCLACKEIKNH